MQARKHTSERSTLTLKPRADVTRSPKQGCQWPHKKDLCPPKTFFFLKMSIVGFSDKECETQKAVMQAKLSAIEEQAYQMAGHPFSLTSTEDISTVRSQFYTSQ